MKIILLRTDSTDAQLYVYQDCELVNKLIWEAGRVLSATLHTKLQELLAAAKLELGDIHAVAVYEGPGSFTGLRIGVSTANALAYALQIPIVGARGEDWAAEAVKKLKDKPSQQYISPYYAAPAKTTKPRK